MKPQLWVSILATGVEPFDAKQTARRHFLAITRGLRGTRPYQRISPVYSGSLACGGRAEVLGSREILRRFGVARVRCGYSIGASGNPARLRPGRYLVLSWWRSCGYSLRRCCRQRPHRIDHIYSFNCPRLSHPDRAGGAAGSRYWVPARHVDPDVTRRMARSAPDALVARARGNNPAVTFCVLRTN
jgi:hypothetical protein